MDKVYAPEFGGILRQKKTENSVKTQISAKNMNIGQYSFSLIFMDKVSEF